MALPEIELEMAHRALAEVVTFMRGISLCPFHDHVTAYVLTPEGAAPWTAPICEVMDWVDCEFRAARSAAVKVATDALGSLNMQGWIASDFEPGQDWVDEDDEFEGDMDVQCHDELGWWTIGGSELMDALRRVAEGEEPSHVYAELYANCDSKSDE